jgi:class 3 adenylate cyclase
VLFADLKGSMELLADRDPEEARKLLDPVLERMMEAVHRYEGTVNQVMGDGIMALFGAPLAHEDHAVRACYAALRMQEAVRRYSEELRRGQGVELQIRVGLNSGDVVVRSIGSDLRMDYSAVGQTTNLAARMEQLAAPGSIRLTAETLDLAEGFVQVTPLGPVPIKGVAQPVEVFELVGAGAARTRLEAAARRGLYVKAGLEKDKAAMLVVLAALRDGRKVIMAVESGHRESTESWAALLRDLQRRGLRAPRLVIGDGHLGIWGALAAVYPTAAEQRCWNHRRMNVLDKLPRRLQPAAKSLLAKIPLADTCGEAEQQKRAFETWCTKKGVAGVGRALDRDWERMVAFYQFPKEHWKHLRTTNPIESPFAAVRLRTAAAKRYKKVANATAVIWQTLLIAEQTFRKLDAPELLVEVAEGVTYINGVRVKPSEGPAQKKAAA